jgi:hypothetical protein
MLNIVSGKLFLKQFPMPQLKWFCSHTANEGPVRIQFKCLVPIYVFPVMKLLFPKQKYTVLSPNSYTHISVRDLYISWIGLPILLQGNMWTDPGIILIDHRHMNFLELRPRNSQKKNRDFPSSAAILNCIMLLHLTKSVHYEHYFQFPLLCIHIV